jgi:hypothetical protein
MAAEPLDDQQHLKRFYSEIEDFLEERARALDHGMSPDYVRLLHDEISAEEYARRMMSANAVAVFDGEETSTAERRRLEEAHEEAKSAVRRAEDRMTRTQTRRIPRWLAPWLWVIGMVAPAMLIGTALLVHAVIGSLRFDQWPQILILLGAIQIGWLSISIGVRSVFRVRVFAFAVWLALIGITLSLVMRATNDTAVAQADHVGQAVDGEGSTGGWTPLLIAPTSSSRSIAKAPSGSPRARKTHDAARPRPLRPRAQHALALRDSTKTSASVSSAGTTTSTSTSVGTPTQSATPKVNDSPAPGRTTSVGGSSVRAIEQPTGGSAYSPQGSSPADEVGAVAGPTAEDDAAEAQ